jgi:acyl phosphate:glycerol-3-phosphate acyltransferase
VSALDIVLAVALGLGGYLLGSIPFALVVGKWGFGVDVRDHGSGNVGTTNVFRVLGRKAGVLVLVGDMTKGFVPAFIAGHVYGPWLAVILGVMPVLGHMYSVFLRGSGGKGVATAAAVILALMPMIFVILAAVWVVVLLSTRLVSLASLCATVGFVTLTFVFHEPLAYRIVAVLVGAIVVWAHRGNIRRLALRCENRVSFPWSPKPAESSKGGRP